MFASVSLFSVITYGLSKILHHFSTTSPPLFQTAFSLISLHFPYVLLHREVKPEEPPPSTTTQADSATFLLLIEPYDADSAAFLLLILPSEDDSAAFLPLVLRYENDSAAIQHP